MDVINEYIKGYKRWYSLDWANAEANFFANAHYEISQMTPASLDGHLH